MKTVHATVRRGEEGVTGWKTHVKATCALERVGVQVLPPPRAMLAAALATWAEMGYRVFGNYSESTRGGLW